MGTLVKEIIVKWTAHTHLPLSCPKGVLSEAFNKNGKNGRGMGAVSSTHVEGRRATTWSNYKNILVDVQD